MAQNKNKKQLEGAQVCLDWIKLFMVKSYFPHMVAESRI